MQSTPSGKEKGMTLKEKEKEKMAEKVDRLPDGVTIASPRPMILSSVGLEKVEKVKEREVKVKEKEK